MEVNFIHRLALGSFVEEYNNKVQIVALDENVSEFNVKSTFDHPYPTTKIMWIPDSKGVFPDLLATSGDYLRVWRAVEPETRLECILNNVRILATLISVAINFTITIIDIFLFRIKTLISAHPSLPSIGTK